MRCKRYNHVTCLNCNRIDFNRTSEYKKQIFNYIKVICNLNIDVNNRSMINNTELDIYIPDLKIAFEFNGLYWHSELFKDKNYHRNKTLKCNDVGIKLIHIWEDDWSNK